MNCNNIDIKYLKAAYKKLKSYSYYDRTNVSLRGSIAKYETSSECTDLSTKIIDTKLKCLLDKLSASTDEEWCSYEKDILSSVGELEYPKKCFETGNIDGFITIHNFKINTTIEETQSFIDMNVEGHILGVLWILLLGYKKDSNFKNCYSNRIKESLYSETGKISLSPYLFEPYWFNYESWRDKALDEAQKIVAKNKNNHGALIITMDFKKYFYSVDISQECMDLFYKEGDCKNDTVLVRLNKFVFNVFKIYSELYHKNHQDNLKNIILPIGFMPSYIFANWCLNKFDKVIVSQINPAYYGRYVDDVIIVDKIDNDSELLEVMKKALGDAKEDSNASGNNSILLEVFKYFFINKKRCPVEIFNICNDVFLLSEEMCKPMGEHCDLKIQSSKTRCFYFANGEDTYLLKSFRETIERNKSEFRYIPRLASLEEGGNDLDIYDNGKKSLKLRENDSIQIDKYKLSKWIGVLRQQLRYLNYDSKKETLEQIQNIFVGKRIIENYILWENIIGIILLIGAKDELVNFTKKVIVEIDSINLSKDNGEQLNRVKSSLKNFYMEVLSRQLAHGILSYDKTMEVLKNISDITKYKQKKYEKRMIKYIQARLLDKRLCEIIPKSILAECKNIDDYKNVSFVYFNDIIKAYKNINSEYNAVLDKWTKYEYLPYIVKECEIEKALFLHGIAHNKSNICSVNIYEKIHYLCCQINYGYNSCKSDIKLDQNENDNFIIKRGENNFKKLKIAVGNARINKENFLNRLHGKPDLSYERFAKISELVNIAIKEKVNMLVLPECYMPVEWLDIFAYKCAIENIALVVGIEHIIFEKRVYNYTAVILPYKDKHNDKMRWDVFYHSKNHFSPGEIELIKGYNCIPMDCSELYKDLNERPVTRYELYNWNNVWFSVYCCFELASIKDRSKFQSVVDFLVMVEWNQDTNYFANIIESLSRDLHCYCVQANMSEYGDSRITQPTKTEKKDIVKIKGGDNDTVIVGTIDIHSLREFQIKEYNLQKEDKSFKFTSPNFNRSVVEAKIRNNFQEIESFIKNN